MGSTISWQSRYNSDGWFGTCWLTGSDGIVAAEGFAVPGEPVKLEYPGIFRETGYGQPGNIGDRSGV